MVKKPYKIHLKISIGSDIFVLGSLSINLVKGELCYLFHHSETAPDEVRYINSGEMVAPLDHITWHRKRVQIRSKSGIVHYVEYPEGDLFPLTPQVVPLLVEGIFLYEGKSLLRRDDAFTNFERADEYLQLSLRQPEDFSLVIMMVPSSWPTNDIFLRTSFKISSYNHIPLWYLRSESHEIGRILAFPGWDICVWTTPFVRKIEIPGESFGLGYRIPDFVKPSSSLSNLILQAKKRPILTAENLDALRLVMNLSVNQKIQNIWSVQGLDVSKPQHAVL